MIQFLRTIFGLGEGRVVGFHFDAASLPAGCAWLVLAAVGGVYLAYRLDRGGDVRFRDKLIAMLRAIALVIIVWILLQPTLITESPQAARQRAVVLLDASRSMGIVDDDAAKPLSRWSQAVDALDASLEKLAEAYELECYTFDDHPQRLSGDDADTGDAASPRTSLAEIRKQLAETQPHGDRTGLGAALSYALRMTPTPSTVLVFSDGVNNWGPDAEEPVQMAREMGVRLLFVATGGEGKRDVNIARFDMPDVIPVGEANDVKVHLQQNGYTDEMVTVVLRQEDAELDRKQVRLTRRLVDVPLSFTGRVPGQYNYSIEVLPLEGESSSDNNRRVHKAKVIDHKPQVLLVEQRPRWEWRFALAGLRRDRRVGGGVKAFLGEQQQMAGDQDQRGRLFLNDYPPDLESLSKFDVVVLGDLPLAELPIERQQALERFVSERGGGLILLAGPNHAPAEYFGTPLGDMLPVIRVDAAPAEAFAVQPVPTAWGRALFLAQESDAPLTEAAWNHSVLHRHFAGTPHPLAETVAVRAESGTGQPPWPVVLMRRYGRGRVLYIGSDDFWRLRGPVSGDWHNRFWIQAVIQTGMQKILGGDAHLELKPGKRTYFPQESIEIQGTTFARDFSPSEAETIQIGVRPAAGGETIGHATLTVLPDRPGQFAGQLPAPEQEGSYILSATDPVSDEAVELCLQVAATGPELESTRADRDLLEQLATSAGGLFCDPAELPDAVRDLQSQQTKTLVTAQTPLWTTPWLFLLFVLVLGLAWWRRADRL